jgi:DNA-binding GntR family transcriptional regulator
MHDRGSAPLPRIPDDSPAPNARDGGALDLAYRWVRDGIVSGRLEPGQVLREEELAATIGVSRTPVREAIGRLRTEGLVERLGLRQNRVCTFVESEMDDILELRVVLESFACGRAATRIADADIEALAAINAEMEAVLAAGGDGVLERFAALNNRFHLAIVAASRNQRLLRVLQPILDVPVVMMRRFVPELDGHLRRSCAHHREIVAALRARNAEWAGAEMRAHLLSAASTVL